MSLDYKKTDAPTASLNTLWLLILIRLSHKIPTASFDVSSAYLYSPIEDVVYVQPPTEIVPSLKGEVMLLKKSLYGTKQAARCSWKFFNKTIKKIGFHASEIEPSLYLFWLDGKFIIFWLYVDDGFAMESSQQLLDDLQKGMENQLEIKWTGEVRPLVGINFLWDGPHLTLNQQVMAQQIVDTYHRKTCFHHFPLPEIDFKSFPGDPVDQTS